MRSSSEALEHIRQLIANSGNGTQAAFAKKVGMKPQQLSRVLMGDQPIPIVLCDYLGWTRHKIIYYGYKEKEDNVR